MAKRAAGPVSRSGPSARLALRMAAAAAAAAPREACGLVVYHGRRPVRMLPLPNVAPGRGRFEIAPADFFRTLGAAEGRGLRVGGVYHSHPRGPARLSRADLAAGWDPDWVSFVTGRAPGGWEVAWFSASDGRARPLGSRFVRRRAARAAGEPQEGGEA